MNINRLNSLEMETEDHYRKKANITVYTNTTSKLSIEKIITFICKLSFYLVVINYFIGFIDSSLDFNCIARC